jgi:hypothetical protein
MRADQMFARGALSSKDPLSQDELHELRRRAWLEQRLVILPLESIRDERLRSEIARECNRQYGSRWG